MQHLLLLTVNESLTSTVIEGILVINAHWSGVWTFFSAMIASQVSEWGEERL